MSDKNPSDLTGRNNKARKAQIERLEAKLTKRKNSYHVVQGELQGGDLNI